MIQKGLLLGIEGLFPLPFSIKHLILLYPGLCSET